jgi:tetratricopeptide (TPR) repeat protein
MFLGGSLDVLYGDDFALTEAEALAIGHLWGYSRRDRSTVRKLHGLTGGWAAGLVLSLRGWHSGPGQKRRSANEQALFDYLAREVLEGWDHETRKVLLETALAPRIDGAQAHRLTGIAKAQEILDGLLRSGYFVTRRGTDYQFHQLFRTFLQQRAEQELAPTRRADVRAAAARMFEEAGQVEDAVGLFTEARAWNDAGRLIAAQAPMFLRQGRAEAVARWVLAVPEDIRNHDPVLLLNLGQALVIRDLREALGQLERSFELFHAAGDGRGAYLAWAAIVETFILAFLNEPLDHWIAVLDDLRSQFPDFGGPEIETRVVAAAFNMLAQRQPWHPALPAWEARALSLALSPGDAYLRTKLGQQLLFYYGACVNDLAKAKLVADAVQPLMISVQAEPAAFITWHLAEAVRHNFLGDVHAAREAVNRGLAASADSGLRALDAGFVQQRIFSALQEGDLDAAEAELCRLNELRSTPGGGPLDLALFHHCALLLARRRRDLSVAREHARACREFTAALGSRQGELLLGISCTWAGPTETLESEMETVLLLARRCGNRYAQAASSLALALTATRHGDEARAVKLLGDGFSAARDVGCLFFVQLEPGELSECCAMALEHDIEPEYVCKLIHVLRLPAGERTGELQAWPWELRIQALGELAILRDGQPVHAGRKQQKKPLEMLRLLVAKGAQGMRQELLGEALWPDADGDAALHALQTTIYRLRRLLGKNEFIIHHEGRVALDPVAVFVDAWALGRVLDRLDSARATRHPDAGAVESLSTRVRELYRGELLVDSDDAHVAGARQKLHRRVAKCLGAQAHA